MLDINSTFFVQILNFLVLLLVLKKFAWGPLLATLHARTEKIENNIRMADEDRAQAAEMKKEYEAKLADARSKAQEILDAANQRAAEDTKAQKESTRLEVEKMKETAKAQIQMERDEAAKQMKGHMITLSLAAAAKLMGRKMDDAADEQIVAEFIDGLTKDKIGDLSC